ncbi:MAG: LamG domain-containing protein [Gammaproteobacteria bacterium]|nr:LamG domain-containing protein [Gammaproteobacteria bacterium]MCW8986528.1 LamG domain-containing protein [Gammaproteobacteria bacterium]
MRKTSGIIKLVSLAWLTVIGLSACGGGASTEGNQNSGGGSASGGSLITASTSAEVIAYEQNVWQNLSSQSRCGRCHSTGGQAPQFVHGSSIETAYAAALSFVNGVQVANLASPNDSRMVTVIRNGHKQVNGKSQACWLATDADCADAIRDFIIAWNGETSGTAAVPQGVQLVAPSPLRDVSASKTFPLSSSAFATWVHTPLLTQHCAGCHTSTAATPIAPYFASNDVDASYLAAQQKMDLLDPANSRLVLRLREEFHNCWSSDCAADANAMELAITNFANTITTTQVDSNLIISKAMKLQPPEAIIASGGERHATNQIALWEFKTGTGNQAFDTSGVEPLINLSLSGNYNWVGGYGIGFTDGRAQATYQASQKLLNNIRTRGEYSVEAWIIPANVVQQNKNIISYSGSSTERNFTIAQNEYNYQFYNRATTGGANANNGGPVLETDANDEDLQASQQHIVMNYDPVNGRSMYVNGVLTGDIDANDVGGLLTDWNNTHAFILANELGQSNPWQGTFRMVAIHNRILTDAQVQQNYNAGVGEKFFLLFSISHIPGVPADSYIKMQVEQFDTYSYLFNNPVYVNLGNPTPTIDFPIAGMRVGINGKEAIVGQSFINLETNRITTNNQEISRLGSVIQLQQGTQVDDFFLSFETLGTQNNPFVVAAPSAPPAPADLPAQSDIGVRTFSEINATMSDLTGVPTSNNAVLTKYNLLKQQLPSAEGLDAFGPANIIGIAQLAFEYCDRMIEDTSITGLCERTGTTISARQCMFDTFDFSQAATTSAAFTVPNKTALANALYDRMIGIPSTALGAELVNAPTRAEITGELITTAAGGSYPGNLVSRLITESCPTAELDCTASGSGTREIVKAMCTSVLGSAAMLVQ